MTHRFPFGAIESQEALALHVGKTLYWAYGLGSRSWIQVLENISPVKEERAGFPYIEATTSGGLGWSKAQCFLGDANIVRHQNSHYLFHDADDADAYLLWARDNTYPPTLPPELKKYT